MSQKNVCLSVTVGKLIDLSCSVSLDCTVEFWSLSLSLPLSPSLFLPSFGAEFAKRTRAKAPPPPFAQVEEALGFSVVGSFPPDVGAGGGVCLV